MGHAPVRSHRRLRLTPDPAPDRVEAMHAAILAQLDDDQALDVVSIPLAGKSTIADYMVIASGRSARQVAAMAGKLDERLHRDFGRSTKIEGLATADWVLLDAGDIIVHLFRPEVRAFYALEKMWALEPHEAAAMRPDTALGTRG